LAPDGECIELSNEGLGGGGSLVDEEEDGEDQCRWNVVFNLPIPGWLPASSRFGLDEAAGTRYGLYATAKLVNVEDASAASWFSILCAPFRSSTKHVSAYKQIKLKRFANTPSPAVVESPLVFPSVNYPARMTLVERRNGDRELDIPEEVFADVEVMASVQECIDIEQTTFPFAIRLRSTRMHEAHRKRLQVTGFVVHVIQTEVYRCISPLFDEHQLTMCVYRTSPSQEYRNRFPLPPSSSQPPAIPLLNPHPLSTLNDLDALPRGNRHSSTHSFSLVPSHESCRYALSGNGNYIFSRPLRPDTDPEADLAWFTMESSLPLIQTRTGKTHWSGPETLRVTGSSPLFCVSHEMRVSITFSYDLPGREEKAVGKRQFLIPLHFVRITPPPPAHATSNPRPNHSPASSTSSNTAPLVGDSLSYTETYVPRSLPAYSQLFDSNGDRKIDYSVPLPMYEPPEPSSSSAALETARLLAKSDEDVDDGLF
jgi:hypothetical protein